MLSYEVKGIISPTMNKKLVTIEEKVKKGEPISKTDLPTNNDVTEGKDKNKLTFKEKLRIKLKAAGKFLLKGAIAAGAVVGLIGILMPAAAIAPYAMTFTAIASIGSIADATAKVGDTLGQGKSIFGPIKAGAR